MGDQHPHQEAEHEGHCRSCPTTPRPLPTPEGRTKHKLDLTSNLVERKPCPFALLCAFALGEYESQYNHFIHNTQSTVTTGPASHQTLLGTQEKGKTLSLILWEKIPLFLYRWIQTQHLFTLFYKNLELIYLCLLKSERPLRPNSSVETEPARRCYGEAGLWR